MILLLGKLAVIDEQGTCESFNWWVVPKKFVVPESWTKLLGLGGVNRLYK